MGVFYIVFAHLFQRGDTDYVVFLLTGLTAWKWFHATVNTGANSLIAGSGLMNQVYLPKIIFPLTNIAVNTFKFFIILSLLLIFLICMSVKPSWQWGFLPLLVLTQLFFIMSVTFILAALMPFFPDFKMILDNILMMLFFLSGVFFDINSLSPALQSVLRLNPMGSLIHMYRMLLFDYTLPDWPQLFYIILLSFSIMLLSLWLYYRFDRIYPKIIH
jgi:lipopolysaccharide transport system permease protein